MSNNWFNYPPPAVPGVNNYNSQANYNANWYNGAYPLPQQQPQWPVQPQPNFNQPPPNNTTYNQPQYQYDYGNYYQQFYGGYNYGSSSTYSESSSLNYADELESYRNTKAHYERAQIDDDQRSYCDGKSRLGSVYSKDTSAFAR